MNKEKLLSKICEIDMCYFKKEEDKIIIFEIGRCVEDSDCKNCKCKCKNRQMYTEYNNVDEALKSYLSDMIELNVFAHEDGQNSLYPIYRKKEIELVKSLYI